MGVGLLQLLAITAARSADPKTCALYFDFPNPTHTGHSNAFFVSDAHPADSTEINEGAGENSLTHPHHRRGWTPPHALSMVVFKGFGMRDEDALRWQADRRPVLVVGGHQLGA